MAMSDSGSATGEPTRVRKTPRRRVTYPIEASDLVKYPKSILSRYLVVSSCKSRSGHGGDGKEGQGGGGKTGVFFVCVFLCLCVCVLFFIAFAALAVVVVVVVVVVWWFYFKHKGCWARWRPSQGCLCQQPLEPMGGIQRAPPSRFAFACMLLCAVE